MNTAVLHEVMSCSMAPVCHATRCHFPQNDICSLHIFFIVWNNTTLPLHQQWKVPYSFMQVLNTCLVWLILITFQIQKRV